MKSAISQRLMRMAQRLTSLDQKLSEPDAMNDLDQFRALSQERAALAPVLALFDEYRQYQQQAAEAQGLLQDSALGALAAEELAACEKRLKLLEQQLQIALLPKDPDDTRNVFLEIRAGTGGDESSLFAADLFRMYTRFVERSGWRLEMVSQSPSEIGGFKEVILRIVGEAVFASMKFESGGHRVQRVPTTEAQGRVHTSACTVAVMPEADPVVTQMPDSSELRIDTFRASGAGGQHVNRTDSAVRITHLPTGLVIECQDDRSQHRNKAQAMSVLLSRLQERNRQEHADRTAAARRLLIGTGDRSERIRTYNFPQNRVTDHRIHLTLHRIGAIMDGDLEELIVALRLADEGERMKALETESASPAG